MRMWRAPTNFGIKKDASKYRLFACFLDLKFALRTTQNEANFKSRT